MTSESLRKGLISTESIKESFIKARGDIFLVSSYLSCSPREIDNYVRSNEELHVFVGQIDKVKNSPDYEKYSAERFKQELEIKSRQYKDSALDTIHELASLPMIDENGEQIKAALADVKLRAAIKLLGDSKEQVVNSDHQLILAELNAQYASTAPRIKSIRIAQVEYETGEKIIERVSIPTN